MCDSWNDLGNFTTASILRTGSCISSSSVWHFDFLSIIDRTIRFAFQTKSFNCSHVIPAVRKTYELFVQKISKMCLLPHTLRVENAYSCHIQDSSSVETESLRLIYLFHELLYLDSYRLWGRITTIIRHKVSLFSCIIELIKELYLINFEDSDKWRAAHEGF